MTTQNIRLIGIVLGVAGLLLFVYVAMKLTGEMKWSAFDFTMAGVLLLGTGLACERVLRLVKKLEYRIALLAVVLLGLFLIWAEVGVGLFGTRFAGS